MIRYCARPELHCHKHIGLYIAFGVCAYRQHRLIAHIPDVFCHRREALDFIRRCNDAQPELIHLNDLIEDVLESPCF